MKRLAFIIFIYGCAAQGMDSHNHPLFKANTADEVKKCLTKGYNVNTVDDEGKTALIRAAINKNHAVFFALLELHADVMAVDNGGISAFTYLHRLALQSQKNDPPFLIHMMACLIERDAPFNEASPFLVTILSKSASFGYLNAVKRILAAGIPVDSLDHYGQTALHRAAQLLQPEGSTKEMYRRYNEHKLGVALALIEAGANPNLLTPEGQSPLTLAIASNYDTMARTLLSVGALNVQQGSGLGAFGAAIKRHESRWGSTRKIWREVAQLVVKHPSFQPRTEQDVIKSVAFGRDTNAKDGAGMTSLMHAILTQNAEVFVALVQMHADILVIDNAGLSAFDYAHALAMQVDEKDVLIRMMGCLIDRNCPFNQASPLLSEILYKSALFGYAMAVKRIIDTGLMGQDQKDRALHWTSVQLAFEGESEAKFRLSNERKLIIARQLLLSGANINRTSNIGQTPLAFAIEGDYKPMIKLLLASPGMNVRIGVLSTGLSVHEAAINEYNTTWFANRIAWDEIVQLIEKHPSFNPGEERK